MILILRWYFTLVLLHFLYYFFIFANNQPTVYHALSPLDYCQLNITILNPKDVNGLSIIKFNKTTPVRHDKFYGVVKKRSKFNKKAGEFFSSNRISWEVVFDSLGKVFDPHGTTIYYYSLRLLYFRTYYCLIVSIGTISNID